MTIDRFGVIVCVCVGGGEEEASSRGAGSNPSNRCLQEAFTGSLLLPEPDDPSAKLTTAVVRTDQSDVS